MKLADLFNKKIELVETPQLNREVLKLKNFPLAGTSIDKMNREYDIIYRDTSLSDLVQIKEHLFIALSKDRKSAVAGLYFPEEERYQ